MELIKNRRDDSTIINIRIDHTDPKSLNRMCGDNILLEMQNKSPGITGAFIVVLPGFEPGLTEPKSVVLPLHHRTIRLWECKCTRRLFNFQIIAKQNCKE